jgi:hypothetical protein
MKIDISRQFPILGTKWLLKKNIEIGEKKVKSLKTLLKDLGKEKTIVYRPIEGTIYLFPEKERIRKKIKYYENIRLPKLKQRLKKVT